MTKTADDILERLRVEREELLDVAEQVLEQMAVDPQGVDPSDKFVFQVLGMSEEDVRREVSRMNSVIKWRPMAGTNAEYAEAVETLDALQKSVPEEVERIQSQIRKLSEKLSIEQRKLSSAEKAVQTMESARRALRESIPARIRKLFDDRMVQIRSSRSSVRMRELAARKRTIEQVLQDLTIITPKTSRSIILHAQAMKVQGIVPPPSSLGTEQRVNEEAWNRYLDQLREELPTIEPELKQLQM